MSATDLFTIVTPTLNSEQYLDETIASVVNQAGDFSIRYHVQDGGSKDGTIAIIEAWQDRIASGTIPVLCRGITFSFSVSQDGGMYQAINRAFATARNGSTDTPTVMGWINSDDRLAPGAFATIRALLTDLPEVEFLTSRVSLINDVGTTLSIESPIAFDRTKLAAGDNDGRDGPFVMQEGTFWTSALWDKVGGLDETFRLAGDWDLWRRMAHHASLTTVDALLGFHRRRPGQLSESLDRYYAEIDRLPEEKAKGTFTLASPAEFGRRQKLSVVQYRPERKTWAFGADLGSPMLAPLIHTAGIAYPTIPLEVVAGASASIGPNQEFHLPTAAIWMNQRRLFLSAMVPAAAQYTLVIECRNWYPDNRLTILMEGETVFDEVIGTSAHRRNLVLRVPLQLPKGRAFFEIESDRTPKDPQGHFLLVVNSYLEIASVPDPAALPERDDEPALPADGHGIDSAGWGGLNRFIDSRPPPVTRPGQTGLYGAMAALEMEIAADKAKTARLREELRASHAQNNLLRLKDAALHR